MSCTYLDRIEYERAKLTMRNRDKPSPVEDFPMRGWSMRIFLLDEEGNERPADMFTKVVYNLHPTFETPVVSMLFPACLEACALVRGKDS